MYTVQYDPKITYVVLVRNKYTSELNRVRRFKNYYRMLEYVDWVDNNLRNVDTQIIMKEKGKRSVDITLGVYS